MKMKHKRIIKRIVAGIFALLMAYVASFGNPFVFPFAVGFVLVQYFSWRFSNVSYNMPALDCSVIVIIIISAIVALLSSAVVTILIFAFGIAGALLSYMLTKVETNEKKRKKRNFML